MTAGEAASTPGGNAHPWEDVTSQEKTTVYVAPPLGGCGRVTPDPDPGTPAPPALRLGEDAGLLGGLGLRLCDQQDWRLLGRRGQADGLLAQERGVGGARQTAPIPVPGAGRAWSPGPPQPVSLETAVEGWAGGEEDPGGLGNPRLLNDAHGSSSKNAGTGGVTSAGTHPALCLLLI